MGFCWAIADDAMQTANATASSEPVGETPVRSQSTSSPPPLGGGGGGGRPSSWLGAW